MALNLSSAAIAEKNKLEGGGAWLVLLKVVFSDSTTIRACRNNEDIVWPSVGGYTWYAFPFELDDSKEEGKGDHSVLVIRIGNVTRTIQTYMEADGANGGVGANVTLYVVHSDHLDLTTSEVEETFICTSANADSQWASFSLSAPNQVRVLYPSFRYIKNFCRWSFQDNKCGYSGSTPATNCDKTINDCRYYGNVRYFGGFPGIPDGSLYAEVPK